MEKEYAAGLLVFRRIDHCIEYLLLQASYDLSWSPPKGHLEAGESDFRAALRETREEAGYTEEDLEIYKNYSHKMNIIVEGYSKSEVYFLAEVKNREQEPKLSKEHVTRKWVQKDEAIVLVGFADFNETINKIHHIIVDKLS